MKQNIQTPIMNLEENIGKLYRSSKTYLELVSGLIELGIQSYTVDVATSTILYRLASGNNLLHKGNQEISSISPKYDEKATIQAVRNTQAGKTSYPEFMNEIAQAGIRFYEATLNGNNKRVTYIGADGHYEETIPL